VVFCLVQDISDQPRVDLGFFLVTCDFLFMAKYFHPAIAGAGGARDHYRYQDRWQSGKTATPCKQRKE
jgi:hypothetical protein